MPQIATQSDQNPVKKPGNPAWVKGVSGNPAGPKPNFHGLWSKAWDRVKGDPEAMERLVDSYLGLLYKGNVQAWMDLLDRTEGKVGNSLTIKDERPPNPLDGLAGTMLLEAARRLLGGEIGGVPQVAEIMEAEIISTQSDADPDSATTPPQPPISPDVS